MTEQELQQLISGLDIADDAKASLIQRMEQEGLSEELLDQIDTVIEQTLEGLAAQRQQNVEEVKRIYEDAQRKIAEAYERLEQEAQDLEIQAQQAYQTASTEVQEAQLDEVRKKLSL